MPEASSTRPASNALEVAVEIAESDLPQNMGLYLATATRADITSIVSEYRGDHTPYLLDIGAGNGMTAEQLCQDQGFVYCALDVDETVLKARQTPRSQMIRARSENLPVRSGQFDITYSQAVTAWSKGPERAIVEQLRATRIGGVAIFTELDWSRSSVSAESDAIEACMGLCAITKLVLTMGGFKIAYGVELGAAIDTAIASQDREGVHYTRQEIRHEAPEGDYRELLLEAGEHALEQLQRVGRGRAETLAQSLTRYLDTIQNADHCIIRPPALVSEFVTIGSD